MRIMACYDDSEESKAVLSEALKQAQAFSAEVLVVSSVLSAHKFYPGLVEPRRHELKEAEAFFCKKGIPCTTLISFRDGEDDAGEDLVMVANKEKVDEIILGIRNRSKLSKLILGSVAQYVMLHSPCPVIGVRKRN